MPIDVTAPLPRLLPVLLLVDASGSMAADGKIDVLNDAVGRMIAVFKKMDMPGCEISLSVISFGGVAKVHLAPTSIQKVVWSSLGASGQTPMGEAFSLATALLNDPTVMPLRSFRPNIVLVSDGIPTDEWNEPLTRLGDSEHGKRAFRFAVGIGADARLEVLKKFAGKEGEVVPVERVELLTEFFRYVTLTVTKVATRPVKSQTELPTFKNFSTNEIIEF